MKHIQRFAATFLALGLLLGIKDGYLAIWNEEDPQPVCVLPCKASSLPPADQILLRRGLHAAGPQELMALLEDYW